VGKNPFADVDSEEDEITWRTMEEDPTIPRFLSTQAGGILLVCIGKGLQQTVVFLLTQDHNVCTLQMKGK
jgi:hypothetical protein